MWTLAIGDSARGSFTSTAVVAPATARALGAAWSSYVLLQHSKASTVAAFRLEISADVAVDTVQIDHWPQATAAPPLPSSDAPQSGDAVAVQCIAAPFVRAVQYLELVPAAPAQPPVSLAFMKRLLRQRVFVASSDVLTLQCDGIDYGQWRYRAYFAGRAAAPISDAHDVGIVDEQTLVLQFPFAASRSAPTTTTASTSSSVKTPQLQPIGAHGESFKELMALALEPAPVQHERSSRQEVVSHARSVLLHGASGAGKTTLVELAAAHFCASVLTLDCSLLAAPHVQLQDLFTAALRVQPAVLLLEDLELLFPRELDEAKYRLVGRLARCLDAMNSSERARVAVVGTVTDISALHRKVRQLFAEEVALEMPTKQWSADLLQSLLPAHVSLPRELLVSIAVRYGQRPSNMASIARQIALHTAQASTAASHDKSEPLAQLSESDIEAFAREVSTASTALATSVPDVRWSDIGGLDAVKQRLLETVVWPLERPHVFLRMGIAPPLGMLLHGPPGTGKTMLAKAAARASGCNFLNVAASDLLRAEVGESEKAITRAFDTARALSPCMVFIDEFQSLFGSRSTAGVTTSRMISQLLMEMDSLRAVADDSSAHAPSPDSSSSSRSSLLGHDAASAVATRVFVLAATNALQAIDPAFLQPGRFENVVYVGVPDAAERRAILTIQRHKMPWDDSVDVDALVRATVGANAASLVALCQAAAIAAMQRIPRDAVAASQRLTMRDFDAALASGRFAFEPPDASSDRED